MGALNPKHVLVPTDFSDESIKVVEDWLAKTDDGVQLTVLHVAPEAAPSEADLTIGWSLESNEVRSERLHAMMRSKFSDPKYAKVNLVVVFGTPATEIAQYAQEHDVDLIALPSHGRTGLARVLIGSVAERVVRLAHCPVLVMRD